MDDLKHVGRQIERIHGDLYEVFIINNDAGEELRRINVPLKVEVRIHDILEMIVGASILAVPVAFTEEVWTMGEQLAWSNVFLLALVGILFLAGFIYFTAYRKDFRMFRKEFFGRVVFTYFLSLIIVGFLLTVVDKCPWFTDFDLALKRTMIGAFPAALSATVTDTIS